MHKIITETISAKKL